MPQPINWQNFHNVAENATKAIDQLPFVFGSRDTQNFHAGTTPEQAFQYMYGPQNKAAWGQGGASSLQSLLGLLGSGGGLLGDDVNDDRDDGFDSGSLGTGVGGAQGNNSMNIFGGDADWSFGGPILTADGRPRGPMNPADVQHLIGSYSDPRNYSGWNSEMMGGFPVPGPMR